MGRIGEAMAILEIGRSESRCGACHGAANMYERGHFTLLGYGPQNGQPGCGVLWDEAVLTYKPPFEVTEEWIRNSGFNERVKNLLRKYYGPEDTKPLMAYIIVKNGRVDRGYANRAAAKGLLTRFRKNGRGNMQIFEIDLSQLTPLDEASKP
jgi:hypothetical protein